MITTSDLKKGTRILINNEPFQIQDINLQSPTARGGGTLAKIKARSLLTGRLINETYKSGTKFEEPDIHYATVQYLYRDGENEVFMNSENYEQFSLSAEAVGGNGKYLNDELKIKALYFNNNVVNVELPQHVELTVTMVEPGERGNTSSGSVTTRAELSNGMEIQVPLNTKEGQKILVDTATDLYYQRA